MKSLKDVTTVARIRARMDRAEDGNLGDYKALGTGLFELKFNFGAGYRVYFALDGTKSFFSYRVATTAHSEKIFKGLVIIGRII